MSRSLQLLAAVALLTTLGILGHQLWRTRQAVIDNATQQVTRLDMVFAEQTSRAVQTVDLTMQTVADLTPDRVRANPGEAASVFRRRMAGVKQIAGLAVADATGLVAGASNPDLLGMLPAAGLSALAQHRADPDTALRISDPLRDWNGRWMALITRRLSTPDGAFAGMTIAYLNLAYFENFYEAVDLNENGSILLHHRNGTVLARFPRAEGVIGTSYAKEPPFADILAHKDAGTVVMPSPFDGKERILAIRGLKAFPLAVSVSVGEEEVLAAWWTEVWAFGGGALFCGAGLAGMLLLLSRRARKAEMAEQCRALEEVSRVASLRALAGVLSRTALGPRFDRLLANAKGDPAQVALLLLDIGGSKPMLGGQGHKAVGHALRLAADRIAFAAGCSQIAPWGTDDFVIITPEALANAADGALGNTAQFGLAATRDGDPALGAAPDDAFELELDLHRALDEGALSVSYQPIIEMPDERCVAFEALIRWDHPTRGVVPPAAFIPVAERSGLIGQLGRWVLERACQDAADWPVGAGLAVSVNVSMAQIMSGTLAADVRSALAQSGLPASRLHLELTESMVGSDHLRIVPVLQTLREMGVGIALDDFGTGFSSLSRLRTWPVDIVKIDRSFVEAMDTDGTAVIRATLLVAREYGLTVTVEGVETVAQWRELMSLGVQNFQGYLFSQPLAAESVAPWLEQTCAPKVERRRGWGRANLEYSVLLDRPRHA